jgi:hypothetical protein
VAALPRVRFASEFASWLARAPAANQAVAAGDKSTSILNVPNVSRSLECDHGCAQLLLASEYAEGCRFPRPAALFRKAWTRAFSSPTLDFK